MNKQKIFGILAIVVAAVLVFGGVAKAVNYFYGPTTVNQGADDTGEVEIVEFNSEEGEVGISDQSGGFVITKTVTNSDIATTTVFTGLDITNTVSGALIVEDIIVSANNTVIAGCTGIVIKTDTSTGEGSSASTTIMAIDAIASIEANETIDFKNANTSIKTRMVSGSNLQVLPTDNPCTGDGKLTFTMFFSKVDEQSFIYE